MYEGFLWAVSVKFKVKLLLIDLLVPVKQVSHSASQQAFLMKLFKAHCQFLGFVIYDKNVKMNPLKVRAKLCTQIHELLWLRAAEQQRKKKLQQNEREKCQTRSKKSVKKPGKTYLAQNLNSFLDK